VLITLSELKSLFVCEESSKNERITKQESTIDFMVQSLGGRSNFHGRRGGRENRGRNSNNSS
jgi:hypothetical protein